jgi:ribosome-associated protein
VIAIPRTPATPRPKAKAKTAFKAAATKTAKPKLATRKLAAKAKTKAKAIPAPKAKAKAKAPAAPKLVAQKKTPRSTLLAVAEKILDDGKAEDIVTLDLQGKSDIADYMLVATANSTRQVAALAQHLVEGIKTAGHPKPGVEGLKHGDWVLVDAGDVIVHLFRPETRAYYNLEKMWRDAFPEASGQ